MRTLKGEWVTGWYCPKCHKMVYTPQDVSPDNCPYCDWEYILEKSDKVIVAIPVDIPDEFMVRLP